MWQKVGILYPAAHTESPCHLLATDCLNLRVTFAVCHHGTLNASDPFRMTFPLHAAENSSAHLTETYLFFISCSGLLGLTLLHSYIIAI